MVKSGGAWLLRTYAACLERGALAPCDATRGSPLEEGAGSEFCGTLERVTLGEIATEFAMETRNEALMDVDVCGRHVERD